MYNDPKIPKKLLIDITRFTQVIMNFLGNAIKFTNEGKVTIESYWTPDIQSIPEESRTGKPRVRYTNKMTSHLLKYSSTEQ